MTDFKVGQTVELVRKLDGGLSADIGDVGTIEELTNDPDFPINIAWLKNGEIEAVNRREIVIIKDYPVEEEAE
ncbi:hypothetical protein P3T75_10950 [Enterococcus montenegrensis]|uniref:hypothetical protein n=1 Tax=Enterococcus montenegrensis TaxID=3031993 RepID=UPI00249E3643|nr:hypothetical protein [Enterococcus montenegrensis]WHA08811.1 hypothetical protein P3T75_10950 [Enterococcus montenegrensis]